MELYFVTSNFGKFSTLKESLKLYNINSVTPIMKSLNIIEPQLDCVFEVSKYKGLQAFDILNSPVLVEDGGLEVDVLKGFPGVYTKYVLETIGVDGILKLLANQKNRNARFISVTTFVDANRTVHQFERENIEYTITEEKLDKNSPFAWSELWKVIYVKEFGKTLCEFTTEDLKQYSAMIDKKGSIQKFVDWFASKTS